MNLKGAGIFPLLAIIICFSPALCEKYVEVISPIVTLRDQPSAASDSRGIRRKGEKFIVNGESGPWYRISLANAIVWIPKSAVTILQSTDTVAPATPASVAGANAGQTPTAAAPPQGASHTQHTARPAQPSGGARGGETPKIAGGEATSSPGTPGPATPSIPPAPGIAGTAPEAAAAAGGQPLVKSGPEAAATVTPAAAPPAPKPKRIYRAPKGAAWVTSFSHGAQEESGKELFYFQVSINHASIFSQSNTAARILTEANKGDFFPLLEESGDWCKIALAQDTIGWIERKNGAIVNAPTTRLVDELLLIVIIATVLVIVTAGVVLYIFLRRKSRTKNKKGERFNALIIAKTSPPIHCIISNKTMSLEKYLSAVGFSVKSVHVLAGAQRVITKQPPDVVFIDWGIADDIPGTVEVLFAEFEEKKLPFAVFFNVPDLTQTPLIPVLLRAYHLGSSISDHDISKLITPTMLSRTSQKSSAASALEGDIAEGNLPEIMQFIEIGKKSGCLLIETDSPVGMVYFSQGRIVHAAAANNVTGRDAINQLLGLKKGKFRFLLNKQPKVSDLNLSTLEVLMEWTKTEDEAHRH